MIYSISSISNRDVQLLYHYRILKQPSDYLKEVFRELEPVVVTFPSTGVNSSKTTENNEPLYEYSAQIDIPDNKVPMLEFAGDEYDWARIQYLTEAEFSGNKVVLYSTCDQLGETTEVSVYWCQSMESITQALNKNAQEIQNLRTRLDRLRLDLGNLNLGEGYLKNPEGIQDNLVKFDFNEEGKICLADSEHQIVGATESQTLMNPSQEELSRLVKDLGGPIRIEGPSSQEKTLEGFTGRDIIITGSGTWIFKDIESTIILMNFTGSFFSQHCTHIRTYGSYNRIKDAQIIQTYLTHKIGLIENLKLARQSTVKHMSKARIKKLEQVGIACEYYSQVDDSRYEPDFEWDTIQGTVNLISGLIIHNGFEVSYQTGHHDDPLNPVIIGQNPTNPSIPGFSKWVWSGDSRTVQMNAYTGVEIASSMGGMGYAWFSENYADIASKEGYNIFFWWGVNDTSSYAEFAELYNQIANSLGNKSKVFVGTVGHCPNGTGSGKVDGGAGQAIEPFNEQIVKFNEQIVGLLDSKITVIDTYQFIMGLEAEHGAAWLTNDNLHYTKEASEAILEFVASHVTSGDTDLTDPGDREGRCKALYLFFRRKGFSYNHTCGILGNIQDESGFDPNIRQSDFSGRKYTLAEMGANYADVTGGNGYGLIQWTGRASYSWLYNWCTAHSLDPDTLKGQAECAAAVPMGYDLSDESGHGGDAIFGHSGEGTATYNYSVYKNGNSTYGWNGTGSGDANEVFNRLNNLSIEDACRSWLASMERPASSIASSRINNAQAIKQKADSENWESEV